MKRKLRNINILFALLFLVAGCKKYLDVVPVGKVIPTTVKHYTQELNAAYNDYNSSTDKAIAAYRSDEVTYRAAGFNSIRNQYLWDENGKEGRMITNWTREYLVIFYANHILANIDKAKDGTQAEKQQLKGEAHLLRAIVYFDLVNFFGKPYNEATAATDKAVPLITEIDLEAVNPRSTVKEVYAQILSDIEKGMTLLNKDRFELNESYRFTKRSANALAARVYLYLKNWEKVVNYTNQVLAVQNTPVDINTNKILPNLYNSPETIQALGFIFSSSGLRDFYVSPDLLKKYNKDTDLRYGLYYRTEKDGVSVLKSGANTYSCAFRVGELYLNLAEAYAQLGKEAEAKEYLNLLKKNRYTPEGYAAEEAKINLLSGEKLLSEIYDERARELAFEGHRWFDLRRTTQPQIIHAAQINGKDTTLVLAASDARYTIKIPREAVNANPKLDETVN